MTHKLQQGIGVEFLKLSTATTVPAKKSSHVFNLASSQPPSYKGILYEYMHARAMIEDETDKEDLVAANIHLNLAQLDFRSPLKRRFAFNVLICLPYFSGSIVYERMIVATSASENCKKVRGEIRYLWIPLEKWH